METTKNIDFLKMTSTEIQDFVKIANKELTNRQKNFKSCSSIAKAILAGEPEIIDGDETATTTPILPAYRKNFAEKIATIAPTEQKALWSSVLAAQIKAGNETPVTFAEFLLGNF